MNQGRQRTMTLGAALLAFSLVACTTSTESTESLPQPAPPTQEPVVVRGPGKMEVRPVAGGFGYFVDGQRTRIRCYGYNTITTGLTNAQRAAVYERDFALMRTSGANFLLGWDQAHFDELLLDIAGRNGLGVVMHFDLLSTVNYADPAIQASRLKDIEAWVQRYRGHPAVAMWGIGNETIWALGGQEPASSAFARFLVQAADTVRAVDATRPVIYREAEVAFLDPILQALATDGKPRPWFVYGTNFFTPQLREVMQGDPQLGTRFPMMLSEFGLAQATPKGLAGVQRPHGYVEMWNIVREFPDRLLGGCAYTWSTEGPEELDYTFAMVDKDGKPVDTTLATLGKEFSEEAKPWPSR